MQYYAPHTSYIVYMYLYECVVQLMAYRAAFGRVDFAANGILFFSRTDEKEFLPPTEM